MGARCSHGNIVIPARKMEMAQNQSEPSTERARRGSLSSARVVHTEGDTPRGIIHTENATSVTIKQRRILTEANEGSQKFDSISPLNETHTSKSTDLPGIKGIYQYKKGPLIGKGSYGEVYECLNLNTGELLAVKSFKVHGELAKVLHYVETLKNEVVVLKNLSHENIVKYYTTEITDVKDGNHALVDIVQEYVSGGSVRKLLDKFNKLEEKVVGTYVRQVLQGLNYLHMQGIVHRNIKGSNILIDTSGTIKLTEFGYAGRPDRFTEEESKSSNVGRVPAQWSAPEMVLKKAHDMPTDIWSVGCVVIEMLTGDAPWKDQFKNMDDFLKKMISGAVPAYPQGISDHCRDFLNQVFKHNPEERPTCIELLEHPFVLEDDGLNNSSYMDAESVNGGPISRTHTPGNFLSLLDSRSNHHKNTNMTRQDSSASQGYGWERQQTHGYSSSDLRQSTGKSSDTKDIIKGMAMDVSRQNTEDKNTIAMFKAYGFDATAASRQNSANKNDLLAFKANAMDASRQNSANRNDLISFKANAIDSVSRQNSEDKQMLAAFKASNFDFRMNTENHTNLVNFKKELQFKNIQEEEDDDASPHPNKVTSFGFGKKKEQPDQSKNSSDKNKDPEQLRRELEEKMLKDLMRFNTGNYDDIAVANDQEEDQSHSKRSDQDSPIKKNGLVENMDKKKNQLPMFNQSEINLQKQKLREEFEKEMENNLARINTEKIDKLLDGNNPPVIGRNTTVAARMIREHMMGKDPSETEENNDNEGHNALWNQNFGDDVLGSFRGFSENNNFGSESKRGKDSPSKSNVSSTKNSPQAKLKKVEFKHDDYKSPEGNRLRVIKEDVDDSKNISKISRPAAKVK